jgi:hypothetical protein
MKTERPAKASPPRPPEVQKAFWLDGELHARFVELLERRRGVNPKTTERALLTEAVTLLLKADAR